MKKEEFCFVILTLGAMISAGCGGTGPRIGDQAVNTPEHYTENRVLFATESDSGTRRLLVHTYELPSDTNRIVKRLAPLGCIIRGVRLPEELKDRRDVAVVLDVVTAGEESITSLVAFYQKDIPGGQMLNFQDLLVYYDPEWDGVTPPWFRVRVLEVNSERNTRTNLFLTEANKLSGSLAGIVPHPVLPSVKTAIEAAKLIFGNKKNKVIIDYQVQFYSSEQIEGAQERLTPLRKGEWMVVGRAKGQTSVFWNEQLEMDVRTGQIHASGGPSLQVPYVSMVLMSADAAVPKHIMDRSQALLQLLDSPTERVNFDALGEAVTSLNSAVKGYTIERRVKKYRSKADFEDLINLIKDYNAAKKNDEPTLKTTQIRALVKLVGDLAKQPFGSAQEVEDWWNEPGVAEGSFIEDKENKPYGVVWKAKNALVKSVLDIACILQ